MPERVEVRVRKVVDGVLYDSETAEVIHYWDERYLWFAVTRFVLGKTPEGHYCLIAISEGTILRPDPKIKGVRASRTGCIMTLADTDAPDSILESLGVEIISSEGPDEPVVPLDVEIVLTEPARFGCKTLLKSPRGRFWMARRYALFGWKKLAFRPVSQREAIRWAIWHGTSPRREWLAMLGISSAED